MDEERISIWSVRKSWHGVFAIVFGALTVTSLVIIIYNELNNPESVEGVYRTAIIIGHTASPLVLLWAAIAAIATEVLSVILNLKEMYDRRKIGRVIAKLDRAGLITIPPGKTLDEIKEYMVREEEEELIAYIKDDK